MGPWARAHGPYGLIQDAVAPRVFDVFEHFSVVLNIFYFFVYVPNLVDFSQKLHIFCLFFIYSFLSVVLFYVSGV